MRPFLLLLMLLVGACAPQAAVSNVVVPNAQIVLATYHGEVRNGELTLTRVDAEGRAVQAITSLATLTATANGPSGTTVAPSNTILLHQTVARSLDTACNSSPYGGAGVPSPFQGVCVSIQAINGYASSEVIRTHVEMTSLTAGVTTYVKAPADSDLGVSDTLGLWYYDRLAAAGTASNLDRRTVNWFFETPVPGASASFSFTVVVKGEVVSRVQRVMPQPGVHGCHVTQDDGAAISEDGRYVAFVTSTTSCFSGGGGTTQLMRLDRSSNTLAVVSHQAGLSSGNNGENALPSISADGRYIAWRSTATNMLTMGVDSAGVSDGNGSTATIFVRDMDTDALYIADYDPSTLSTITGFAADRPSISADGSHVAFDTAAPLDSVLDGNGLRDVYVHDVLVGPTYIASTDNIFRTHDATHASLSGNGADVAWQSADSTFVSGDSGQTDVFVTNIPTQALIRVSVTAAGAQANGNSTLASISADGAWVAFQSLATNLVGSSTTAGRTHVYARSIASDASIVRGDGRALTSGSEANNSSFRPLLDANGRMMIFVSDAGNLDPFVVSNGRQLYAVDTRSTNPGRLHARMVSATPANAPSGGGVPPTHAWIAGEGNYAIFRADFSSNLVGDSLVGPYLYLAPLR